MHHNLKVSQIKKLEIWQSQDYLDAKDKKESYEIGKDYFDHAKEVDHIPPRDDMEEKSTLKKDKKLKNLLIPKKGQFWCHKVYEKKEFTKTCC